MVNWEWWQHAIIVRLVVVRLEVEVIVWEITVVVLIRLPFIVVTVYDLVTHRVWMRQLLTSQKVSVFLNMVDWVFMHR